MYIHLNKLLDRIKKHGVTIQIEKRQNFDYGFPNQHIEILNYINPADNDPWDGLILAYKNSDMEYYKKYRSKSVVGIILVEDGNHKLLFKIPYKKGFDEQLFKQNVNKFIRNYGNKWGVYPKFMNLAEINNNLRV